MNDTNDDLYVPMMTETYDEKESFGSKAGTFCKKFLLLIITVGLLLFLIFQFILISGGKSIKDEWEAHKAAVEAADAEAAAAAEVVDVTPVVDDTTADETQVDETVADETQTPVADETAADETAADETAAETETETEVVIDSSTQGDSDITPTV